MNNKVVKPAKFEKVRLLLRRPRKVFWYWDIRLWSPIICIMFAMTIILNLYKISEISKSYEVQFERIAAIEASNISKGSSDEEVVQEDSEDNEIVMLARLAESVAANRPDEVKKAVMWVAINRAEDKSHGYGLSLELEIARPKQWQCYDPTVPYMQSTYNLAEEVYNTWKSDGPRMLYPDMLWFVLNRDGSITVRNQYEQGKNRAEMTFGQ